MCFKEYNRSEQNYDTIMLLVFRWKDGIEFDFNIIFFFINILEIFDYCLKKIAICSDKNANCSDQ